ncbi:MAG: polymer-forming cytoskeletal protein [Clostridia bacterium]|nr:polymer-forming cytoskeletal protein [Clostridia bacterium]
MFRQKEPGSPDSVDTLIGVNSYFEGNIESQGTIRVDGKVKGDLKISGDVFIGSNAVITGNVEAGNVYLSGTVEGNINATGVLRILSTARLYGDIRVHSFVADEGGIFQGKCSMLDTPEINNSSQKSSAKKTSAKDYKKSSVLDQIYEEKDKSGDVNI